MKLVALLPLLLVACGPSKEDAAVVMSATTVTMNSVQSRAVAGAAGATVNFSGPCTLGGTVSVIGTYDTAGTGQSSAFDLAATFDSCREPNGTLDGTMQWTSASSPSGFAATMLGSIDYDGSNTSASCDFNLVIAVTQSIVSYSGHVCGYDVVADLGLRVGI